MSTIDELMHRIATLTARTDALKAGAHRARDHEKRAATIAANAARLDAMQARLVVLQAKDARAVKKNARIEKFREAMTRRLDALKAGAPAVQQRWDQERQKEEKRVQRRLAELRERTTMDYVAGFPPAPPKVELPPPVIQPIAVPDDDALPVIDSRPDLIPGTFDLLPADRIIPLIDLPPLPPKWTADHVGYRLIEAHATLRRTPAKVYPGGYGACWPEYRHEAGELATQAGAGTLAIGRNRAAVGASADEVDRMGEALAWPMTYLARDPVRCADVNLWASETTAEEFERGDKTAPTYALQQIADALNTNGIAVR